MFPRINRAALFALALVVVTIAVGAMLGSVNQTSGSPEWPPVQIVKEGGAWRVAVVRADGATGAGVSYSVQREGLVAYSEAVRLLGATAFDYQGTIPALVTFRHPITFERFVEMMNFSGAVVKSYRIRDRLESGRFVGWTSGRGE